MARGSVVDDDDEAKFLSVTKRGSVVRVSNAGHSVQGDTPVELAAIISEFIGS
jgi:pimeloyl-ACP methyl ester carboxylesterase